MSHQALSASPFISCQDCPQKNICVFIKNAKTKNGNLQIHINNDKCSVATINTETGRCYKSFSSFPENEKANIWNLALLNINLNNGKNSFTKEGSHKCHYLAIHTGQVP